MVAEAGMAGAVTIATNMAGRGTDIKLGPAFARRADWPSWVRKGMKAVVLTASCADVPAARATPEHPISLFRWKTT